MAAGTDKHASERSGGDAGGRTAGEFKKLGFTYVTLDLLGCRTGSLNEALPGSKHAEDA